MEYKQFLAELDAIAKEFPCEDTQYLNARELADREWLLAEMDAIAGEFPNENEPLAVTWEDIEINDDDSQPVPKEITSKTPTSEVHALLDMYANSPTIQTGLREANKIEAKTTDINCFELKPEFDNSDLNQHFKIKKPKITAVIDWLRLEIVVGESYNFKRPRKPYNDIKDFLKAKGINDNPYVVQSSRNKRTFTIDLHDVSTGSEYENILNLLRREYQPSSLKIIVLEVALDFWNINAKSFMLALAKSIRVGGCFNNKDLRVYTSDDWQFMPAKSETAMKYTQKCYTIGIGHKTQGDSYLRIYNKVQDRNKPLPPNQHRTRIEINLRGQMLVEWGDDANNLRYLTNKAFKLLKFTHLTDDATTDQTDEYRKLVKLFGEEVSIISKSRNKRNHLDHIKSHAKLNEVVAKSVGNFIRNF
ncbi:hypothetical protein [Acinetobacter sp.]|uniref:hypothetical protein n=1 Tax=Acinetobacter sp. TaxID=472 RepID=UPI0031CE473A